MAKSNTTAISTPVEKKSALLTDGVPNTAGMSVRDIAVELGGDWEIVQESSSGQWNDDTVGATLLGTVQSLIEIPPQPGKKFETHLAYVVLAASTQAMRREDDGEMHPYMAKTGDVISVMLRELLQPLFTADRVGQVVFLRYTGQQPTRADPTHSYYKYDVMFRPTKTIESAKTS